MDEFCWEKVELLIFYFFREFSTSESLSQSEVSNRSAPGVLQHKNQPILIKNTKLKIKTSFFWKFDHTSKV